MIDHGWLVRLGRWPSECSQVGLGLTRSYEPREALRDWELGLREERLGKTTTMGHMFHYLLLSASWLNDLLASTIPCSAFWPNGKAHVEDS